MVCRVLKKIHGNYYIYEQQSYRVAGKVKTDTLRCLGRADGALVNAIAKTVNGANEVLAQAGLAVGAGRAAEPAPIDPDEPWEMGELERRTAKVALELLKRAPGDDDDLPFNLTKSAAPEKPATTENAPPRGRPRAAPTAGDLVKIKIDCDRYTIAEKALRKEHERLLRLMTDIGLKAPDKARITIRYGSELTTSRGLVSGNYSLMVPRYGELSRSEFKDQYQRLLSRVYLEELKRQAPEKFCQVRAALDASYRETNGLIIQFSSLETRQFAWVLTLQKLITHAIPRAAAKQIKGLGKHLGPLDEWSG